MSLSGKAALGLVMSAAAAFSVVGAGSANAAEDLYGSLAISINSEGAVVGAGYNYNNWADSDRRALDECGYTDCRVIVQFSNACAAVAARSNHYTWAWAPTRREAEQAAIVALGPDPSPLDIALFSADPSRAELVTSECTANAS